MKMIKDNRVFAWTCKNLRMMRKSGKKTSSRLRLILALTCVLVLGGISVSLAAMTCGAPGTCVVVVDNYTIRSIWPVYIQLGGFDGVDETCSALSTHPIGKPIYLYSDWYNHTLSKWYWDGKYWVQINAVYNYTASASDSAGATVATDITADARKAKYPHQLYPNGCSDLPKPIPDQNPNADPGKPDCPQLPLN